jgi:hypothetical protein
VHAAIYFDHLNHIWCNDVCKYAVESLYSEHATAAWRKTVLFVHYREMLLSTRVHCREIWLEIIDRGRGFSSFSTVRGMIPLDYAFTIFWLEIKALEKCWVSNLTRARTHTHTFQSECLHLSGAALCLPIGCSTYVVQSWESKKRHFNQTSSYQYPIRQDLRHQQFSVQVQPSSLHRSKCSRSY